MNSNLSEWLNLAVRWFHVFAGILWIGQTYYFTWLDGRFAEEEKASEADPASPHVWMVHSGGFYVVEKQKYPQTLPPRLHWFRWEALLTWVSGIVLLVLVYYLGGAMVDTAVADISLGTAILIGVGVLVVGWAVYDLLWNSPLAKSYSLAAAISCGLLVAVGYGLCRLLSGRAAYIEVGALMGTLMAANVWMRILPAQRKMIAAVQQGARPDLTLAARAKLRSKHNTYMVVPLVFLMVSNHFPTATYGSSYNWIILAVLLLVGGAAAHFIRGTY